MRAGRPSREVQLLSEWEDFWATASLTCCPFPPSYVCQRRTASTPQVRRWLYRTLRSHIKEDHILKLCLYACDGVQETALKKKKKARRRSFQNVSLLKQWESLVRRGENTNNSLLYRISHLRFFLFALIYCGNILWAMLLLPSYTIVKIGHW